jgi:hypothetical protein
MYKKVFSQITNSTWMTRVRWIVATRLNENNLLQVFGKKLSIHFWKECPTDYRTIPSWYIYIIHVVLLIKMFNQYLYFKMCAMSLLFFFYLQNNVCGRSPFKHKMYASRQNFFLAEHHFCRYLFSLKTSITVSCAH